MEPNAKRLTKLITLNSLLSKQQNLSSDPFSLFCLSGLQTFIQCSVFPVFVISYAH